MKKIQILGELLKCDTETGEQMLLKNGADRLAQCGVATDLQFVKRGKKAHNTWKVQ